MVISTVRNYIYIRGRVYSTQSIIREQYTQTNNIHIEYANERTLSTIYIYKQRERERYVRTTGIIIIRQGCVEIEFWTKNRWCYERRRINVK